MTNDSNPYCTALGIPVPRLEDARSSPDANYYSLLLVALLERGAPLTLEEAALRFEEVGVAPAPEALASLKRCKPARPPIYRDGDHYSLDPYDDEADLWAFRLGLRSFAAGSKPMPSRSLRSISTVAFTVQFAFAGDFSTKCCRRHGSTATSRCCTTS